MKEKIINKEIILETTLNLIEEKSGVRNVNLREIAKRIGCAHTNIYNYFENLDDIFWESLTLVLSKMMDFCARNIQGKLIDEENLFVLLSNIIDFSIQHPDWYRLIWLDSLNGNPKENIKEKLYIPGNKFEEYIFIINKNQISKKRAQLISNILFNYLHGELCKLINNRNLSNNDQDFKLSIILNLKFLYKSLIKMEENSYEKL